VLVEVLRAATMNDTTFFDVVSRSVVKFITFRMNKLPPSSGSMNELRKQLVEYWKLVSTHTHTSMNEFYTLYITISSRNQSSRRRLEGLRTGNRLHDMGYTYSSQ
jgi:hypothetical protein